MHKERNKTMFKSFNTFLENAPPGQTYIYHRGYLAKDRESLTKLNVKDTANLAMNSYKMGTVDLYQKRISYAVGSTDPVFHYIARKL